VTKSLAKNCC